MQQQLDGELEEYGYTGSRLEEMKKYIQGCLERSDNEHEYVAYAYMEGPSFIDSESVIMIKKTKYWLDAVFDGFDELCYREKIAATPLVIP